MSQPPSTPAPGGSLVSQLLAEGRNSVRAFLTDAPSVSDLIAGLDRSFDRAHAILPSTAVAGESVSMTVQAWDGYERLVRDFEGSFSVESTDPDATPPDRVVFGGSEGGVTAVDGLAFGTPGVQYVTLATPSGERVAVSNPVEVHADPPDRRRYWGDIHLHSLLSDGVGSVSKGLRFGRDVMDLDVVAYTDHDTMGFFIPPTVQRWRMRRNGIRRAKDAVASFHDPGEFVTLYGYEWTKQPTHGGHINVYFEGVEEAEMFDSRHPETRTYEALWERLRRWREETGNDVLTIPHHPAEAMYPLDFSRVDYDDEMAPLVEVYSQWGSSELRGADGNEKPIGGIAKGEIDEPGHYVQDLLSMGERVGMMASADFHGPMPGHSLLHVDPHVPRLSELVTDGLGWGHIWRVWDEESYPGGLVAFFAPELTREAIFDSLRRRAVYGTTQPDRILVDFRIEDVRLRDGEPTATVDAPDAERTVEVSAAGTAPLSSIEVVRNNEVWRTVAGTDDPDAGLDAYTAAGTFVDDDPVTGMAWDDDRGTDDDVYYVRVRQADGGMAWAGPLWVAVA